MADTEHGKVAEQRIRTWLDNPELGYDFTRIYDQMSGRFIVSRNICDFDCYRFPYFYHIESKATYEDRFEFNNLSDTQRDGLLLKSQIKGSYGLVIVLYVTYKRAFIFNIQDIAEFINPEMPLNTMNQMLHKGEAISKLKVKSLNIKKIDKWDIPYWEIQTIPSRKEILDYTGDLPDFENRNE
jgi:hypothetical protein